MCTRKEVAVIVINVVLSLAITTVATAEDPVVFNDMNLKNAVINALGKLDPPVLTEYPTTTQMEKLTKLEGVSNVSQLGGLQYAVNLEALNLRGNPITNIEPLATLTKLGYLDLQSCQNITDISPLANLTNLRDLRLGGNKINNISPLSLMTGLTNLSITSNQISNISVVAQMTNLHSLDLNINLVNDISPLANKTSLWQLLMANNQITDISPLATLTNLDSLNLNYNPIDIEKITVLSGLTRLAYLNLAGTTISNVEPLGALSSLNSLGLADNEISDIAPLDGIPHLSWLELTNNQLSDIAPMELALELGKWSGLRYIYLKGNPLDCYAYRTVIPILEAKGIGVNHDPIPEECLNNQTPVADAGGPYQAYEGSEISFDGTGSSDLDGDALTYAWDFGDGDVGSGPAPTHTYADNSTYTVCLTVTDSAGASNEQCTTAVIFNVAPTVGAIAASTDPVRLCTVPVCAMVLFDDPGTADTHTADWDWGDGSVGIGTLDEYEGSGSVIDCHSYTEAGVYTLKLTVTDDDVGSGDSLFKYVVVYDPSAGFVTGGGWIWSPLGAYVDDPLLDGKASFGFVSKYKKGATVPTGNTEFVFQAGDLNFHSGAYDWLVVTGSNYARFKGSGTINGSGDYKFMLWAGDNQPDTFRIRIWAEDEATGAETPIYDNGNDQAIEGGSIIVHTQ